MQTSLLVLVINPRHEFTKIGIYENTKLLYLKRIIHPAEKLAEYEKLSDQVPFRAKCIIDELIQNDMPLDHFAAVIGRGGLIKPVGSGVYEVNDAMLNDLYNSLYSEDVVNLGGMLADEVKKQMPGARAIIADPVVVDELDDIARISGHPLFERKSVFHALMQKWVARKFAKSQIKPYEKLRLIVAHLGSGITVGAHLNGRVIDVNQGHDGEGPFAPLRSGTLPAGDLVRLCFSGKYTKEEVLQMLTGKGGLFAWFGTMSTIEIEQMAMSGNQQAKMVLSAMAYQVAKNMGSMYAVLESKVDAILISGEIANSKYFIDMILRRVRDIAPVHVFPGSDEIEALGMNGLMALKGEIDIMEYK
ncbi:MAG: butyrate kinase [Bacteroidales bacterium]